MNKFGIQFQRFSDEQIQMLHDASLEILDRTGLRLHHQPAEDLLQSAGVCVSERNRVRIPTKMVEEALSTVSDNITLYDRNGEAVILLDGHREIFFNSPAQRWRFVRQCCQ